MDHLPVKQRGREAGRERDQPAPATRFLVLVEQLASHSLPSALHSSKQRAWPRPWVLSEPHNQDLRTDH